VSVFDPKFVNSTTGAELALHMNPDGFRIFEIPASRALGGVHPKEVKSDDLDVSIAVLIRSF